MPTSTQQIGALDAPQSTKGAIHVGEIFEPLPGIGTNLEPDANRRDFLATAPNQTVKNGNPFPDKNLRQNFIGTIPEPRWHDLRSPTTVDRPPGLLRHDAEDLGLAVSQRRPHGTEGVGAGASVRSEHWRRFSPRPKAPDVERILDWVGAHDAQIDAHQEAARFQFTVALAVARNEWLWWGGDPHEIAIGLQTFMRGAGPLDISSQDLQDAWLEILQRGRLFAELEQAMNHVRPARFWRR